LTPPRSCLSPDAVHSQPQGRLAPDFPARNVLPNPPLPDRRKYMNTTNLKRIRPFLLVACLLALVYGAGPAARAQVTGQWTLVGLHPAASAITPGTHYARTLGTLRPWNGRLYIGYGDYDNNVGDPAKIIPYDPAEDRFVGPLLTSANREWT